MVTLYEIFKCIFLFIIKAFASSLSGSLSTRAVLEGVGVGSSSSTPLAATLMWLIKDGTGMVGRILFAWCNGWALLHHCGYNTLNVHIWYFSTKLDADSKKWRFFADLLNDCALSLELCAPYAVAAIGGSNGTMTSILCVAGVAKSIVGVAGGATRAALTQHQVWFKPFKPLQLVSLFFMPKARQGNLADVSAKNGSQETLVNLAALITSLWLLPLLDGSTRYVVVYFLIGKFCAN